ncbi:MAG: putative baseplate assembly protein, partial [Acidobacteriota bacterium]
MALFDDRTRYACGDEERRATLRRRRADPVSPTTLNGIDFLEVIDGEADGIAPALDAQRQRILLLQCFGDAPADLEPANVRIVGGVRVTDIDVDWIRRLDDLHQDAGSPQGALPTPVRNFLAGADFDRFDRARVLAIGVDARGDFSTYELGLIDAVLAPDGTPRPLAGFDPRLASVAFAFKVECPSPLDCKTDDACPPAARATPDISYLAKDWGSFRRLMLDRLSVTVPDWRERHVADQGVALVEALAWVGDQLSYFQDAAATEAYLGTARRRPSVRRHARLVDYRIDEGAAARAWIHFEIEPAADGAVIPGPEAGLVAADRRPGTAVIARRPGRSSAVLPTADRDDVRRAGAAIFETLEPITLRSAHNRMAFYTWSDRDCCLPAGATAATLLGAYPDLQRGDVLIFEEIVGPQTGDPADADPLMRHAVRLTDVYASEDPLMTVDPLDPFVVTEIRWHADDAPGFPICLSATLDGGTTLSEVSVARGNVVLADHGDTRDAEPLDPVPPDRDDLGPTIYRPLLREGPLTHVASADD